MTSPLFCQAQARFHKQAPIRRLSDGSKCFPSNSVNGAKLGVRIARGVAAVL